MMGGRPCPVLFFSCFRFVLVKVLRWIWLLGRDMSMSRITKMETQMNCCMAIFDRKIEGGLAMA